jgi:hypothetical protein
MGLLSGILTLPLAPVRGVIALGKIIQEQVEQELHSPAAIRARLEDIEDRRRRGLITDEEAGHEEQAVLDEIERTRAVGAGGLGVPGSAAGVGRNGGGSQP